MILLDTHVWIWWVNESEEIPRHFGDLIAAGAESGVGVSIISCWEVAKLVEYGRLKLTLPVKRWMQTALSYSGVVLLDLTPEIVIESTQLSGSFHKDPADQLLVATARLFDIPLLTVERKITDYPHVTTPSP